MIDLLITTGTSGIQQAGGGPETLAQLLLTRPAGLAYPLRHAPPSKVLSHSACRWCQTLFMPRCWN